MIKLCGMRDADNIRQAEQLLSSNSSTCPLTTRQLVNSSTCQLVNLIGFIFWPKSSRYVSERPAYLPTKCRRVGVFVDEDIDTVKRIADEYALDYIQLHGHESPEYIRALKSQLVNLSTNNSSTRQLVNLSTIKAFNIAAREDLEATAPYEGLVDYFLFDTKGKSVGGNGEKFDWSVLSSYRGETPFLLSGGIGPDDAERVKAFRHPKCAGIDINSRFEVSPALKDINKLKTFLQSL